MFSDKVIINVKAGNGGNGAVSFRRERFVDKGGPDGGDGGKGGNVFIQADSHTKTLIQLYRKPHCNAEDGESGRGQKKNGKDGQDLFLKVPLGTIVEDIEKNKELADLSSAGNRICVARGGIGGKGNYRFRGSQRQIPNFAQKGEPGEEIKIKLNLKLIADAGLVGFPNAGKSTLLARISAAKPKIADYPFTTIEPNLGVVRVDEENSFVIADIPGLIKGAHAGVGMGTRFLKHIERTKVLVHLIDGSQVNAENLFQNYQTIENELKQYAQFLEKKKKIVTINKCDLPEVAEKRTWIKKEFLKKGIEVSFISAVNGQGIQDFIYKLHHLIDIENIKDAESELLPKKQIEEKRVKQYEYEPKFSIKKENEIFIVESEKIEKMINRYDLDNYQALQYVQKILKSMGIEKALKKRGINEGDRVKIGNMYFYFYS
jgi:GTP-binding protein